MADCASDDADRASVGGDAARPADRRPLSRPARKAPREAADWLTALDAPRHFIELVRDGGTLDSEEQGLVFGESLPKGCGSFERSRCTWDVAIIGGGPAGLMAGGRAAARGRKTILLDKNREPGVKILLSGGTRCNLTHATDARGIVEAFGPAGRFLHSALAALGPQQVVDLFEAEGVPTKVEPGGKVFPASDRASDVRAALVRRGKRSGCTLALGEPWWSSPLLGASRLVAETGQHGPRNLGDAAAFGSLRRNGRSRQRRSSWPPAGSRIPPAARPATATAGRPPWGIASSPPHTALVPVTSHAPWVLALQGITLPDVWWVSIRQSAIGGRSLPMAGRQSAPPTCPPWPAVAAHCCSPISASRGRP